MIDASLTDPQARKAAIREQARKNRIAQKNKDEVSRAICAKFTALPAYTAAKTVMWYVDAGSEVRTRHTLPEALTHGKRVVVPWCVVETNTLELFLLEDMSELVEGAYKILEPKIELRQLPDEDREARGTRPSDGPRHRVRPARRADGSGQGLLRPPAGRSAAGTRRLSEWRSIVRSSTRSRSRRTMCSWIWC